MTVTDQPQTGAGEVRVDAAPVAEPAQPSSSLNDGRRTLLLAAGVYLLLSLVLWSNVWSAHPTSTTICACGDPSTFIWYFAWPAHAIAHGLNPLHSSAIGYPTGVNLLANTSELPVGILMTPVTWLFGPIASLNVVLTLSPVVSAIAMFVLVRRWVRWAPAAFIGGLAYGFSPFVLVSLTEAHLMLGLAFVPPLVLLCLDELFMTQRRSAVAMGVGLGLLVTVQFFVGSEVLFMTVAVAAIGIAVLVTWAALRAPDALRLRAPHAVRGVVAAGVTSLVLLLLPVWYSLAGPARISGPVWPGENLANSGARLSDYFVPSFKPVGIGASLDRAVGGYQGALIPAEYVGLGMMVVLLVGLVIWRRDRRLIFFSVLTTAAAILSLGAGTHIPLPWRLVGGLPLFQNVIPERFALFVYLGTSVMLAIIVDHVRRAVGAPGREGAGTTRTRRVGPMAGILVAAVALVPQSAVIARTVPFTVQSLVEPQWVTTAGRHLPSGQVVLIFPAPFSGIKSSVAWEALDGLRFALIGTGGPGGVVQRAGKEAPGQAAISNASFSFNPDVAALTSSVDVRAVRQALDGWGVTTVVIPDQPSLPIYERTQSVKFAAALIASATGEAPFLQDAAWVWTGVGTRAPTGRALLSGLRGLYPRPRDERDHRGRGRDPMCARGRPCGEPGERLTEQSTYARPPVVLVSRTNYNGRMVSTELHGAAAAATHMHGAAAATETELASRLRLAATRLHRKLRQQTAGGLTPSQASALSSVERLGSPTLGELAAREAVQPPSMTRIVGILEEQGYLARVTDTADRRVARVAVTPKGGEILRRSRSRKDAFLVERLHGLPPEERAALPALLELLEHLVHTGEDARP